MPRSVRDTDTLLCGGLVRLSGSTSTRKLIEPLPPLPSVISPYGVKPQTAISLGLYDEGPWCSRSKFHLCYGKASLLKLGQNLYTADLRVLNIWYEADNQLPAIHGYAFVFSNEGFQCSDLFEQIEVFQHMLAGYAD